MGRAKKSDIAVEELNQDKVDSVGTFSPQSDEQSEPLELIKPVRKPRSTTTDEPKKPVIQVIAGQPPSPEEKKEAKINKWKPKEADRMVACDKKIFYMFFDKVINAPEEFCKYNKFHITKASYEKQLDIISRYINYFIKFYDYERELMLAFVKIKFAIDKERLFTADNADQLIDLIYEVLFTDSMVRKINQMVEDNYLDDIESPEESKKYTKDKKHLESLEFTNQHIKILLRISFGMKCIAPILFHYVYISKMKLDKTSDLIYRFYRRLFTIFADYPENADWSEGPPAKIDMYNKLFVYVKAKVLESDSHNRTIFDQRDILGYDIYTVIHLFLQKVLISENMVKYKFNENWNPKTKKYRENITGFNKTIIKYQLMYFLKDQYSKNLTEVTSAKNADGLSGMDKMEMNMQKIDEGLIIMSEENVKSSLERIRRNNDFVISDEEIQFYIDNHHPDPLQINFVFSYWCNEIGSYRNTSNITLREYIELMLIMKKRLLLQSSHNDDGEVHSEVKLPYMLSGNVDGNVNNRIIRNNKFQMKINSSYLYNKLIDTKYSNLSKINPDEILGLLSRVINTSFTYVTYENPELTGKPIEYNEDRIADELLFFLTQI